MGSGDLPSWPGSLPGTCVVSGIAYDEYDRQRTASTPMSYRSIHSEMLQFFWCKSRLEKRWHAICSVKYPGSWIVVEELRSKKYRVRHCCLPPSSRGLEYDLYQPLVSEEQILISTVGTSMLFFELERNSSFHQYYSLFRSGIGF